MNKPKKIGTIINAEMVAAVQIINDKLMIWETIDHIIDTPKNRELIKIKYKNKSLWLNNCFGRRMI